MPEGHLRLRQAVSLAAKPGTVKFGYNLYNDTDEFADIQALFRRAGFTVEQEKSRYLHEKPAALPASSAPLTFKTLAEEGEQRFVETVRQVTVGTLDRTDAQDARRLGGERAAREYVETLKSIDFDPDRWKLGYRDGKLVGLILPQRFDEKSGAINYVGVLPECRGKGYGLLLLAEGTRTLTEAGVAKIYADIDVANKPMAAALERLGYVFMSEEVVLGLKTTS